MSGSAVGTLPRADPAQPPKRARVDPAQRRGRAQPARPLRSFRPRKRPLSGHDDARVPCGQAMSVVGGRPYAAPSSSGQRGDERHRLDVPPCSVDDLDAPADQVLAINDRRCLQPLRAEHRRGSSRRGAGEDVTVGVLEQLGTDTLGNALVTSSRTSFKRSAAAAGGSPLRRTPSAGAGSRWIASRRRSATSRRALSVPRSVAGSAAPPAGLHARAGC